MKNLVNDGGNVTVPAPYDVASGDGVLVGTLFGVAQTAALSGTPVVLELGGTYDLAKAGSQAWTIGAQIYWDAAAKRCTTTDTDNTAIGKAVLAVGAGATETVGRVVLK